MTELNNKYRAVKKLGLSEDWAVQVPAIMANGNVMYITIATFKDPKQSKTIIDDPTCPAHTFDPQEWAELVMDELNGEEIELAEVETRRTGGVWGSLKKMFK